MTYGPDAGREANRNEGAWQAQGHTALSVGELGQALEWLLPSLSPDDVSTFELSSQSF